MNWDLNLAQIGVIFLVALLIAAAGVWLFGS